MKKTIILSLIALAGLFVFGSCRIVSTKDGTPVSTTAVPVSDFHAVSVTFPAKVVYVPSDTFGVTLEASEKARKVITIAVKDGTLNIDAPDQWTGEKRYLVYNPSQQEVKVIVRAPSLDHIAIYGSGSFLCDTVLTVPQLYLEVAGSGNIRLSGIAADRLQAEVSGSGNILGLLFRAATADIQIAGSGNVVMDLHDCGQVDAEIAGSGNIRLSGNARKLTQNVAGSGIIDAHGLSLNPTP